MAAEEWVGRVIDQRYISESVLGMGGMGVVLRAKHRFTGQHVALKVLKGELSSDPAIQSRFLAEAQAPSAIGHPGIVRVLDAGRDPSGFLYLVMELLEGRSLRVPMARGELTPLDARRIMLELLDPLAAAHTRGFVHRDLKPDNVFLVAPTASVRLLDFGIAKVLDAALASVRTATGVMMGTPAYMSPEQLNDSAGVDARTDLWACGVILYEMLSGRLPFRGDRAEMLLVAIATQEADPIRAHIAQAPPQLETFFQRALARDPRMRFGAAAEMANALTALPLGDLRPVRAAAAAPVMTPPASYAASVPGAQLTGGHVATAAPSHVSHASNAAFAQQPSAQMHAQPSAQMHAQTSAPMYPQPSAQMHAQPYAGAPTPPAAYPAVAANATPMPPPGSAQPVHRPTPQPGPEHVSTLAVQPKSRATLIVGIAAAAAVAVLVVLVLMRKSESDKPTTVASKTGSGSGSAEPTESTPPPKTEPAGNPNAPTPQRAGGIKSRLERIANGEVDPTETIPAPTTARTTSRPDPKSAQVPKTEPKTAPKADPPTQPDPPAQNAGAPTCEQGCAAASRCGVPNATCVTDCKASPVEKACVDLAAKDCNAAAQCAIKVSCGSEPYGTSNCEDSFNCMFAACMQNPKDPKCGCACAVQVAPKQTLALLRVWACLASCPQDANWTNCVAQRCKGPADACQAL